MGSERGRETESAVRRWLSCLVTRSTLAMQVEKYVHVTSSLSLYFYAQITQPSKSYAAVRRAHQAGPAARSDHGGQSAANNTREGCWVHWRIVKGAERGDIGRVYWGACLPRSRSSGLSVAVCRRSGSRG
jgi:hypothetical protein